MAISILNRSRRVFPLSRKVKREQLAQACLAWPAIVYTFCNEKRKESESQSVTPHDRATIHDYANFLLAFRQEEREREREKRI